MNAFAYQRRVVENSNTVSRYYDYVGVRNGVQNGHFRPWHAVERR